MDISATDFRLDLRTDLPPGEVHLWRVDLAAVAAGEQRWTQVLSEDERTRAARFHFSRDRQHYTATRALLRIILSSYLGADPNELRFRYSDKEKPSLISEPAENVVEFNVSHSGTIALLVFARGHALGVDVEQMRRDFDHEAIAARFFSENERHQLAALAPGERHSGFFRCWTRKEAYVKAVGTGLSLPLHQFDVSLEPGEENALLRTRPDGAEAALWSMREIPAGDGYVAALCVRGHDWTLKS